MESFDKSQKNKLWAQRSYVTANLVVKFGYYLGALPVQWNISEHKMYLISSMLSKIRWWAHFLVLIAIQICLITGFGIIMYKLDDSKQFSDENSYTLMIIIFSSMTTMFHIHTVWKHGEFVCFINKAAAHYEFFQNNYAAESEWAKFAKEDSIGALLKLAFLGGANLVPACFSIFYLFKCEIHPLNSIMPMCYTFSNAFSNWIFKLSCGVLNFYFMAFHAAGLIIYVDLFAAVVLMGLYVVREMTYCSSSELWPTRRTNVSLNENTHWFKCYRCADLILKHINDCIGQLFMPVHMVLVVITTAVLSTSLIKFKLGLLIDIFSIMSLVMLGFYYIFLIGRGSQLCEQSEVALEYRKSLLNSEYFSKFHRSCAPLRPTVGGLFSLKRQTVTTMLESSLQLTLDLLLLF